MKRRLTIHSFLNILLLFSYSTTQSMEQKLSESITTNHPELTQSVNFKTRGLGFTGTIALRTMGDEAYITRVLTNSEYYDNGSHKSMLNRVINQDSHLINDETLMHIVTLCVHHKISKNDNEPKPVLFDQENYEATYGLLKKNHSKLIYVDLKTALHTNNEKTISSINDSLKEMQLSIKEKIAALEVIKQQYCTQQQSDANSIGDQARKRKGVKAHLSKLHIKEKYPFAKKEDCSDDDSTNPDLIAQQAAQQKCLEAITDIQIETEIDITENKPGNALYYDNHYILTKIGMNNSIPTVLKSINDRISQLNQILEQLNNVPQIQYNDLKKDFASKANTQKNEPFNSDLLTKAQILPAINTNYTNNAPQVPVNNINNKQNVQQPGPSPLNTSQIISTSNDTTTQQPIQKNNNTSGTDNADETDDTDDENKNIEDKSNNNTEKTETK